MTDLPSSLGIEAVELVADGGRGVTVRVTGRWRRRRPELRGQPILVIDAESGRQRFLAMPEPPSLTGAAPGTWRMSFSVPADLASTLPGRTFLQIGGVLVPLPVGDVDADGEGPDRGRPDLLRARVERLERELDGARAESDRLRGEIADRERRLRTADQHVHAERALRVEVEQELSRQSRAAERDLGKLRERVADLERELAGMRRAVDEAQHFAAAADAARADAERRATEHHVSVSRPSSAEPTRRELALYRASLDASPAAELPRPAGRSGDRPALELETAMVVGRGARQDARVAALERKLAAAREEIDAQRRRSARAYEAIELVRGELRELRAGMSAGPPPAATATVPPPIGGGAGPAGPVQAERLSAALARLRAQPLAQPIGEAQPVTAAEPVPLPGVLRPWLGKAFRVLVARDASAAGRLLLALLPAQRVADPRPVVYDLVLSDVLVARVTVASAGARVEFDATARPLPEVDFRLTGDLAGTARFLVAGRVRRRLRLGRRLARFHGDRDKLAALETLIAAPLTLKQLNAAGVRPEPTLCLTLAALMIEPEWTAGERFVVAHQDPRAASPGAYVHIRDDRAPLVTEEPPHGPVASVIVCPADGLLAVLAGEPVIDVSIAADQRPWSLIRQWLDRAQCG